jgi:hypothetical protein
MVYVVTLNWLTSLMSNKPDILFLRSSYDGRGAVCSISCFCIHLKEQLETFQ